MHWSSGNRIPIVTTKRVIVTVRQIQTAQMPITINADVADFDRVRPHIPNQRRARQKSVPVVLNTPTVVVVERAGLNRVTLADKVLPKNVRDVNVLLPPIETIE